MTNSPVASSELRDIARRTFGWNELHPGIAEAAQAAAGGRDVLAVMPTGYADAGAAPFRLHDDVEHEQWGHGLVMRVERDRITAYFDDEGYKVLSLSDVLERGVLRRSA